MITLLYIISEKRRIEPVHIFSGVLFDIFIAMLIGAVIGAF